MKDVKRFNFKHWTEGGLMGGPQSKLYETSTEVVQASDYDALLVEYNKMKEFRDNVFDTAIDQIEEFKRVVLAKDIKIALLEAALKEMGV